jgi:hypothetical protein
MCSCITDIAMVLWNPISSLDFCEDYVYDLIAMSKVLLNSYKITLAGNSDFYEKRNFNIWKCGFYLCYFHIMHVRILHVFLFKHTLSAIRLVYLHLFLQSHVSNPQTNRMYIYYWIRIICIWWHSWFVSRT